VAGEWVLVTGGAGFIGSHTVVELLGAGHDVVVVDDFSNRCPAAHERAAELGGSSVGERVVLVEGDYGEPGVLDVAFGSAPVSAVVHFAGLKAVGESVEQPLRYYRTNVAGSLALLAAMQRHGVRDLVFSSSCTVYGEPERVPLTEDCRLAPMSPYGRTKLVIEEMIADVAASEPGWRALLLRYFNPVGAHPSGDLGEDPTGVPQNLMPYVMRVAHGQYPYVRVFGADYPTPDGTCIRDYIHVVDLADGHVAALEHLGRVEGCRAVNLGTGRGSSVLEVLAAAAAAVGHDIAHELVDRRPGDVVATWADPSLAESMLGWRATRTLADMCADAWRWQQRHPAGFQDT
jgi:UDP-glucose 4-epimerase